jgi:hypothetical protein
MFSRLLGVQNKAQLASAEAFALARDANRAKALARQAALEDFPRVVGEIEATSGLKHSRDVFIQNPKLERPAFEAYCEEYRATMRSMFPSFLRLGRIFVPQFDLPSESHTGHFRIYWCEDDRPEKSFGGGEESSPETIAQMQKVVKKTEQAKKDHAAYLASLSNDADEAMRLAREAATADLPNIVEKVEKEQGHRSYYLSISAPKKFAKEAVAAYCDAYMEVIVASFPKSFRFEPGTCLQGDFVDNWVIKW